MLTNVSVNIMLVYPSLYHCQEKNYSINPSNISPRSQHLHRSLDFKKAKNKQKPSLEAQKWAFLCKFLKILSVYSLHTFTYGV